MGQGGHVLSTQSAFKFESAMEKGTNCLCVLV